MNGLLIIFEGEDMFSDPGQMHKKELLRLGLDDLSDQALDALIPNNKWEQDWDFVNVIVADRDGKRIAKAFKPDSTKILFNIGKVMSNCGSFSAFRKMVVNHCESAIT